MQKNIWLFLFLSFFFTFLRGQERGDLFQDTLLEFYDPMEIEIVYDGFSLSELFFPIQYSVELYRITYWTAAATGDSLTLASGLVSIPVSNECSFPLLNYNHGTLPYDHVLSEMNAWFDQHLFGIPFAANGYVSALPDYLGYGATPPNHPHLYLHAKSEATAVVDILRAARHLCEKYAVSLNDQVFLLGYSQGGHVTMAAAREIQNLHADEFELVAVAPCSGPYDLSGIGRDSMLFSETFSYPFFISFSTLSYQYVYGNIYEDLGSVFRPPYDQWISWIFDRSKPQSNYLDSLPLPGTLMFEPLFLEDIISDSLHPINEALRQNDLYDWAPKMPMLLFYCEGDEKVPYIISEYTERKMMENGALNVRAESAGENLNHEDCTYPAIVFSKLWFDVFRVSCTTGAEVVAKLEKEPFLYPNPFERLLWLDVSTFSSSSQMNVYDLMGRKLFSKNIPAGFADRISLPDLPAGSYYFEIRNEKGRFHQIMIRKG